MPSRNDHFNAGRATFEVGVATSRPPKTSHIWHTHVALDPHDGTRAGEDAAIHQASLDAYHMAYSHPGVTMVNHVRLKDLEI